MSTKKQKILYGSLGGVTIIAVIASLTLSGSLFKGFLLQPLTLPEYVNCAFGRGSKVTKIECPQFDVQNMQEGSYDVLVEYGNKNLGEKGKSIVPIKVGINNGVKDFVCEYSDQGYVAEVSIASPSALDSDKILTKGEKITMGSLTQNLKINMKKDGKSYPYDLNICGSNLSGTVTKDGEIFGDVKYGLNGLLNKSGINQIAIAPKSLYFIKDGSTRKPDFPGNYELTLDGFESASFIFSVPCSVAKTEVRIDDLESDSAADSALIVAAGLTESYVKQCADKLYLSIHNTKNASDFHTVSATFSKIGENYALIPNMYELKNILQGKDVSFPMTYKTFLHEKDGNGSTEVKNLATFTWTITGGELTTPAPDATDVSAAELGAPEARMGNATPFEEAAPTEGTAPAAPTFYYAPPTPELPLANRNSKQPTADTAPIPAPESATAPEERTTESSEVKVKRTTSTSITEETQEPQL